MPRHLALLLVAVLCAACDRPLPQRPDREMAAAVLHGLLAYPQSSVVSVASGSDAAQVTFATPAPVDVVATWYRQTLRMNGWELQSDAVMNDGTVAIFAQQGKRPLWITLKTTPGGAGTTYTLIGSVLPSDSATAQRSGSRMSSNRIQRR
jgi:hypothetical protein